MVQGRPLSSFRQRDMSLNEAQPSVLWQTSRGAEADGATGKVIGSISAPRTVYSRFEDAEVTGNSQLSNDRAAPSSNSHTATTTAQADLFSIVSPEEMYNSAKPQKVKFRDSRNQVTMYTPSPTTSPMAAPFRDRAQQTPNQHACHDSESMESAANVNFATYDEEQQHGGVSRCASNLASRAGTFDEIMDEVCRQSQKSTQASDTMVVGACPAMASQKPTVLTGDALSSMISSDNLPPPSRCASNMTERAGTFEEILADQIEAHPLSLVDSLLDDSGMLSNASLSSQQPHRCPPTRCVSNMMSSAGTFTEVLSATEDAVDRELFDGTISRRATNMHTAAGAFEELVDEDGDELDPEEHSCSSLASGSEVEAANISLSGLVSDTDILHASAAERAPLIMFQEPPVRRRNRGGSESVAHFTSQTMLNQGSGARDLFVGMLPSDEASQMDECGGGNPLASATGPLDVHEVPTKHDVGQHGVGHMDQHADMTWMPQQQQSLMASQSRGLDVTTWSGSNSRDRLAFVQGQIDSLNLEEQRLLLSTLSARLNANPDTAANAASLPTHLSIHTPHRTLTQFQLDDEAEEVLTGSLGLSNAQLQKTLSTRGMSVRTPRVKYDVVFTGDENAQLPSAMDAIEDNHNSASRAILTPMEWSLKFARKQDGGPNHGALEEHDRPQHAMHGKVMLQPTSTRSADCTTRLVAYRPDEHCDSVWAGVH